MSWSEWADAVEIEPSIYASDFSRLGEQLEALRLAGAKVFHFDVGDGHFIPEITIGPVVLASISPLVSGWDARLDCHLMVSEPERHFEAVANAGGDSVTFHVEASDDPPRAIAAARALGLGVGVAFNPETPVQDAVAAADGADLVLCMSIHPGYSGQAFMTEAIERLAELRAALPASIRVQVDGGINRETVRAAREAGADLLVAGSAVFWSDDPGTAYRELVEVAPVPELLELREPDRAFGHIEDWLAARGFFAPGGAELVAELYLGYGLSQSIRRSTASAPHEPCPTLPLAACRLNAGQVTQCHKGSLAIGEWEQSWTAAEYGAAVDDVRAAIARGDVYQVNLVQHLQAPFTGDPVRARETTRAAATASARAVRHRHLDCGLGIARALPLPPRRSASGRCRSREPGRAAKQPSSATRRRTRPST